MSEKKYKLTDNTKTVNGITLYQIQSLKAFFNVEKDEVGGWIEKESNLSQDGNAWVYGDARVYGDAEVYGNARVSGDAICENNNIININTIYNITITQHHIQIGCEQKTIQEWKEWLKSDKVIQTERNTDKFKKIEKALKACFLLIKAR